jgi:small subunit ribosomal protein S8
MKNHFANMIAIIKNGQLSKKAYVNQTRKKLCEFVLNILWDEGFISGYNVSNTNSNQLRIFLKYSNGKPAITSIKLLTKPSLKLNYSLKQLWKINSSEGLLIISTDKGFMSINDCKKYKVGGVPFLIVK